jgi:hypothetical protein
MEQTASRGRAQQAEGPLKIPGSVNRSCSSELVLWQEGSLLQLHETTVGTRLQYPLAYTDLVYTDLAFMRANFMR